MVIKEFLPNPAGKDQDGEYVTLRNDTRAAVNLDGWKVKDASGKAHTIRGKILGAGEELTLPYAQTKITLNNSGETIQLLSAAGELVDELSYSGSAVEGRVISHVRELTPELKAELFDEIAFQPLPDRIGGAGFDSSFFVAMFLAGAILAGMGVWALKSLRMTNDQFTMTNQDVNDQ